MSRRYWKTDRYYSQPNEQQLKSKVDETTKKAKKKGTVLEPVIIEGKDIVNSWWGKAWCENLERYADYQSRLPRGKRYVKSGTVVDLKIEKGKVSAKVQGTRKTPYKVEIRISPLKEEKTQALIQQCTKKIENLEQLVNGTFPEELKELFISEQGLFPTPREISFSCSCPDWALLCKHVAAVLYGIGNRFDQNPLLFFELRGIDVNRFIDITIENRIETMLENVDKPSKRIIEKQDYAELFGLDLDN